MLYWLRTSSQNWAWFPKYRPSLMAVSAVIDRRRLSMSVMRPGGSIAFDLFRNPAPFGRRHSRRSPFRRIRPDSRNAAGESGSCGPHPSRAIGASAGLAALLGGGGLPARHPKAPVLAFNLAAGEPRILSLVQFRQIRQAIYRQLLSIALASRCEAFNISANFLPRIRSSPGIKGAHRLVGVQNMFNHVIHRKLQNKRTAIVAVHHFAFRSSMRPEVALRCAGGSAPAHSSRRRPFRSTPSASTGWKEKRTVPGAYSIDVL
jgi:hypothetical protein